MNSGLQLFDFRGATVLDKTHRLSLVRAVQRAGARVVVHGDSPVLGELRRMFTSMLTPAGDGTGDWLIRRGACDAS